MFPSMDFSIISPADRRRENLERGGAGEGAGGHRARSLTLNEKYCCSMEGGNGAASTVHGQPLMVNEGK